MTIRIPVSRGAAEYVTCTVTESDGLTISTATLEVSLAGPDAPGAFVPGDAVAVTSPSKLARRLLINASTPPGSYWLWYRLTDTPEVLIGRGDELITVS